MAKEEEEEEEEERILADDREGRHGLSHAASRSQFVARVQESQADARWILRVVRCTAEVEVVAVVDLPCEIQSTVYRNSDLSNSSTI